MSTVLIIIQLIVSVALVIIVLMQKSEGGALGMGGGSGGGLFTPRGAGDALTRLTAILAVLFFATSMALTILALHRRPQHSILDSSPANPVSAPVPRAPGSANRQPGSKPLVPAVPGVPQPLAPAKASKPPK
jgi:preprotein translocase subunit SecG